MLRDLRFSQRYSWRCYTCRFGNICRLFWAGSYILLQSPL